MREETKKLKEMNNKCTVCQMYKSKKKNQDDENVGDWQRQYCEDVPD